MNLFWSAKPHDAASPDFINEGSVFETIALCTPCLEALVKERGTRDKVNGIKS